jgi:ABC-type dipeptide/oligopeptide/nickel transport system ATPase component
MESAQAGPCPMTDNPVLEIDDLRTYFHTEDGVVRAVQGISLNIKEGKTLGVVGESGSGKCLSPRCAASGAKRSA